jgi:hypothetical protein
MVFAAVLAGTHREGHKATAEEIIAGAQAFAASKPDPDYVPIASNWLNAARWLDAPQPATGHGEKAAYPWSNPNWPGPTVHNTDEILDDYKARMVREGKCPPKVSTP